MVRIQKSLRIAGKRFRRQRVIDSTVWRLPHKRYTYRRLSRRHFNAYRTIITPSRYNTWRRGKVPTRLFMKLLLRLIHTKRETPRLYRILKKLGILRRDRKLNVRYLDFRNLVKPSFQIAKEKVNQLKPVQYALKPYHQWAQVKTLQESLNIEAKRRRRRPKKVKTLLEGVTYRKPNKLKARVFKRSLFARQWKKGRSLRWVKNFESKLQKRPEGRSGFSIGRIYVTFRHNNTFMALTGDGKNACNVLYITHAGMVGFAGPKRKTNVAREAVAADMSEMAYERNIKMVDLYFNVLGRVYWHIIKGLHENKIYVRRMIMKRPKAHGFIRPKKERRL